MYNKHIKVKQLDKTDCGAACLSSICAYHGLRFPISRIRQYAFTNQKGTNILGLIEAANKLNLSAKGIHATFETLYIIPKPCIAHVIIREKIKHYIVIYSINKKKKHISYMDPYDGRIHKISYENFSKIWTNILVIMEPNTSFKSGNMKTSISKKFLSLLIPHKYIILQAIFGALIYSILGISMAIYVGKITDYVLVYQNTNLLNLMGIIMILILILRTFIGSMKSIFSLKIGQQIDAALILGYYKHLLTLPQLFFDTMRTGEIISRINDAVKIRNFINNTFIDLVVNIMILITSVCFMFLFSWQLVLITIISFPLFALIHYLFNRLNKKCQRNIMESNSELESQLVESINLISTIKKFGIEEYENLKTEINFVRLLKNTYKSTYGSIITHNSLQFISIGITITILWIGSNMVINKELTPGELMIFYSLIGYIISPISALISSNQIIQNTLIASDRLFQIMDLEREETNIYKIPITKELIGDIVFDHVYFRYGSNKNIFNNLSLTIEKGKITAIIGKSGSGKSTLASLIQHIYSIQKGHIYIGKYNISQINNQDLRQYISCVPQQIELFAGTIVENIALGDLNPNMEKINKLINELGLNSFIKKLPNGLMTYISENGNSLSGGERQRISIARALYKEPEIIIFDEPTSSLDTISENYIKSIIKNLAAKGKTIILIAHRLNTIQDANKVILLSEGEVLAEGSHKQLLNTNKTYYMLFNNNI